MSRFTHRAIYQEHCSPWAYQIAKHYRSTKTNVMYWNPDWRVWQWQLSWSITQSWNYCKFRCLVWQVCKQINHILWWCTSSILLRLKEIQWYTIVQELWLGSRWLGFVLLWYPTTDVDFLQPWIMWVHTYLLLLISMLWHRQAIFKSKGDKLCSSAECRIWTRGPRHQIASRLNGRWQTNWAIEDQAKNLNSTARPYDQRAFSSLDPTVSWLSHLALAIYIFVFF